MVNKLITKKSTVAGKVPLATDLEIGELAVNTADAKLYTKHSDGTVKSLFGMTPEEMPANVDLDTKTTTGVFSQSANSKATLALKYPVALAGLLEVFAYSSMIHQRYWVYNSDTVYSRAKYSTGAWTAWVKSANVDDNVASASALATAQTLTIGSTGKTFNGSAGVSWSLDEIGAAASDAVVDLTTNQTVAGEKTFSGVLQVFEEVADGTLPAKTKFGRSSSQNVAFYGNSTGNRLLSTSSSSNPKDFSIRVTDTVDTGVFGFSRAGNFSAPSADIKGKLVANAIDTSVINVVGDGPSLRLSDTTVPGPDFWVHANGGIFHILSDKNDDGTWETPHPLTLNNTTELAHVYGRKVIVVDDVPKSGNWFSGHMAVRPDGVMNAGRFLDWHFADTDTSTASRTQIDASGNLTHSAGLKVKGTSGLGYAFGGAVTQLTSRDTEVTLDTPSGTITLFGTPVTAGTMNKFTLTNSCIQATDVVVVGVRASNSGTFNVFVNRTAPGVCDIVVQNLVTVATAQAVHINFAIIKGANA